MQAKNHSYFITESPVKLRWNETPEGYVLQVQVIVRKRENGEIVDTHIDWQDVPTDKGVVPVFGRKIM